MARQTYEDRTHRITVAVPKPLYDKIRFRLKAAGYATMSDLVRELLRKWQTGEIMEVKTHG